MKNVNMTLVAVILSSAAAFAVEDAKPADKAGVKPSKTSPVTALPSGARVSEEKVKTLKSPEGVQSEGFKKADMNHDGVLSLEEYKGTSEGIQQAAKVGEGFQMIDRDGDGKLSAEEYSRVEKKAPVRILQPEGKPAAK
jgi:hypothetical protein